MAKLLFCMAYPDLITSKRIKTGKIPRILISAASSYSLLLMLIIYVNSERNTKYLVT